jgi:hypothetical protein
MRKMIFLIAVFMVCLVFVGGAIAQPNKFWAMDVSNFWDYNGSGRLGTWKWRDNIVQIDSSTIPPSLMTYYMEGMFLLQQGSEVTQKQWFSVNSTEMRLHRWDEMMNIDDIWVWVQATITGGFPVGFNPIGVGAKLPFLMTVTFFDGTGLDSIGQSVQNTIEAFEPVLVPMGTFQAYRIHRTITDVVLGMELDNSIFWFAPYIGTVKRVSIDWVEELSAINIQTVFSDVPVTRPGPPVTVNPFYQYIMGIYDEGITQGTGPGLYSPQDNVTREQMAAFIMRAVEATPNGTCATAPFPDVSPTSQLCHPIERLVASGITRGCVADDPLTPENEARYCPGSPVTREQMAAFIMRAVEATPDGTCVTAPFPDVSSTSPLCNPIQRLVAHEITRGCVADNPGTPENEARYCPGNPVTREEMAAFLARAFLGIP